MPGARRGAWVALALFGLSVMLYLPIVGGEFTYDSRAQVLIDETIHEAGTVLDILTLKILSQDVLDRRRPAVLLSLAADSLVWSRRPAGYHLTNTIVHAASVLLLFRLLMHVLARTSTDGERTGWTLAAAAGGALLFAVHPVNAETVCNVSYRDDLLAVLFLLAALNCAAWFSSSRRWTGNTAAVACCLLLLFAAASKENGYLGPVLLAAYWICIAGAVRNPRWLAALLASSVAVGGFVAASWLAAPAASTVFDSMPVHLGGSLGAAMRVQPRLWVLQLRHLLWPVGLCADYGPYSIRNITTAPAAILLLLLASALVWLACRSRRAMFGALLLAVSLLPTANLVPIYRPLADRYMYQPMLAVCLGVACVILGVRRLTWRARTVLAMLALSAGLALCGATLARQRVWRNRVLLWQDTARVNPRSTTAFNNLGFALYDAARAGEAVRAWQGALALDARHADAWAGLAIGLEAVGRSVDADAAYARAVALDEAYGDPARLVARLSWDRQTAAKLRALAQRSPQSSGPGAGRDQRPRVHGK